MNKSKVLTGFTGESDAGIIPIADAIITGCSSNTNFTFTKNELTDLVLLRDDYVDRLAEIPTGTHADVTLKDQSKVKLETGLSTICTEINHQHAGDTAILETSGAPMANLAPKPKGVDYPAPTGLIAEGGSKATEMDVKVDRIADLHDRGIVVAISLVEGAPDDVMLWRRETSSAHKLTVTGLKPGTKYLITAAYQGTADTVLKWCLKVVAYTKAG